MRHLLKEDTVAEEEYRKTIFANCQEKEVFKDGIHSDIAGFWIGVMEHQVKDIVIPKLWSHMQYLVWHCHQ